MDDKNFAVDRNGKRWSLAISSGVLMPLDGQISNTPEGQLHASIPPEEVEGQHGPLTWFTRPDSIAPNDYHPKAGQARRP